MQDGFFQALFRQMLLSSGAPGLAQEQRQPLPVLEQIRDRLPRPEFGSTFFSANWASSQARSFSITGALCCWWKRRRSSGDRPVPAPPHRGHKPRPVSPARTGTARENSASPPQSAGEPCARQWPTMTSSFSGSLGTLRDSASHICIGAEQFAARSPSTSARFSPACWRPVKNSAMVCCCAVETMPAGEHAGALRRIALVIARARPAFRQRQYAHGGVVVVQHFALRRLANQLLHRGLEHGRRLRHDLALRRHRQRDAHALLQVSQAIPGKPAAVAEQRDHAGRRHVVLLFAHSGGLPR